MAAVLGVLATFCIVLYYAHDLPSISNINMAIERPSIMVKDQQNNTIATYGKLYGEWLEYDQIPETFIKAVIATEDRRFFEHNGFDLRGFTRAMVTNLMKGQMVEGGSTITQQLAKNLFLSEERTLKRKIQELLLSQWLEFNFTKEEFDNYIKSKKNSKK